MTSYPLTFGDASREIPTFSCSPVEAPSRSGCEVRSGDRLNDMADPFEVRLYFSNRLRALNPCEDNIDEVATFALKHRDLDEDLHSCILEQLESEENNVNVRANIVYFLEELCELARRERHFRFICMIERDFPKIINAAIPLDGMGIVNVNCVRNVLHTLHYEQDVFCTPTSRHAHNLAVGQHANTRDFDELNEHLDKRALEARPDLSDSDSDTGSEPSMDWINDVEHGNGNSATASHAKSYATCISPSRDPHKDDTILSRDDTNELHDIKSPNGSVPLSRSFSASPVPPTPLSPSVSGISPTRPASQTGSLVRGATTLTPGSGGPVPPTEQRGSSRSAKSTPGKDAEPRSDDRPSAGTPMRFSPTHYSQSAVSSANASPAEFSEIVVPRPNARSPPGFTPVEKEDANIFAAKYFELVVQRMEQDRERQRKKEDNSGFLVSAGDMDEELMQMAETSRSFNSDDFAKMERQEWEWGEAKQFD